MILKSGKPPHKTPTYTAISLMPITAKLFEQIHTLKRLGPIIERDNLIPDHQFGFWSLISLFLRLLNIIGAQIE